MNSQLALEASCVACVVCSFCFPDYGQITPKAWFTLSTLPFHSPLPGLGPCCWGHDFIWMLIIFAFSGWRLGPAQLKQTRTIYRWTEPRKGGWDLILLSGYYFSPFLMTVVVRFGGFLPVGQALARICFNPPQRRMVAICFLCGRLEAFGNDHENKYLFIYVNLAWNEMPPLSSTQWHGVVDHNRVI